VGAGRSGGRGNSRIRERLDSRWQPGFAWPACRRAGATDYPHVQGSPVIKGGCLCGGLLYQYDGELQEIFMCHCSQCLKTPWVEVSDHLPQYPEGMPTTWGSLG